MEQFDPLGLAPYASTAIGGGTRARDFTIGELPDGRLGETDKYGNITIRPGLSRKDFRETLRHETVHSILTPPVPLNEVKMALYDYSRIYRYLEEAAAESYATRSLTHGLAFPIANGYMSVRGLAAEATAVGAVGYAGYRWAQ